MRGLSFFLQRGDTGTKSFNGVQQRPTAALTYIIIVLLLLNLGTDVILCKHRAYCLVVRKGAAYKVIVSGYLLFVKNLLRNRHLVVNECQ